MTSWSSTDLTSKRLQPFRTEAGDFAPDTSNRTFLPPTPSGSLTWTLQVTSYRVGSRSVMLVCPQRRTRRYQGRAGEDLGGADCERAGAALKSEAPRAKAAMAAFFKKSRRVSRPAHLRNSPFM